VRLHVEDERGAIYAPLGRLPVFAAGRAEIEGGHLRVGKRSYSLIDGACEIRLPASVPLKIEASHGPEFLPFERTVTLGPGQLSLRFEMEPWFDRTSANLLSGDTRAHFLSPHDAMLEAAAEDLDVVSLLACDAPFHAEDGNTYRTIRNIAAFSGQVSALERDGRAVVVNTLNEHPMLGRVSMLNSHRPVYPITFGGDSFDDWSIADWCQQCHRKNGLAVWVNAFNPQTGLVGGEALISCILGHLDAVEYDAAPRTQPWLPWVYRVWNAGAFVSFIGGSGKSSNRVPLGAVRTYARLGADQPRNYSSWIEAVREGRCFASNGPILHWNTETGECVAESAAAFDQVELVANGSTIATAKAKNTGTIWRAEIPMGTALPAEGWWAIRCFGGGGATGTTAFAHSSAIRCGQPRHPDPATHEPLRRLVQATLDWIRNEGRFNEEKFRTQMLERGERVLAILG
jgi:hypothetical protein